MNRSRRVTAPVVLGPAEDAPGVVYSALDTVPSFRVFRCGRLQATLSVPACGRRYIVAQTRGSDRLDGYAPCLNCTVGSHHAGAPLPGQSRIFGAKICPACRKGVVRMVGDRVCVSCYNRRREMVTGRNSHGRPPSQTLRDRPLRVVPIRITQGPAVSVVLAAGVVDLLEPMVQALRTTREALTFEFAGGFQPRQLSLF